MLPRRASIRAWIIIAATSLAALPVQPSSAQELPTAATTAVPDPAATPGASGPQVPSTSSGRLGPGSQATEGSNLSVYKLLRYDEDYSYLKDPPLRTDSLDFLKYIMLGKRDDFYLSLGGTARPRYELNRYADFDAAPANLHGNNNDILQRYLVHADLHLGPSLRFFFELQNGYETGLIGGPRPGIDFDRFDAHQGFVDVAWRWGEEEANSLTLRPGRQEMFYGSGRLIDVNEGVNLRRSFDAARALMKAGNWQVDGFWSRPVRNRPGVFDDDPDPNVSFWGLYAVRPLPILPDGHTDLYYLGYQNKRAVYEQGQGQELRHSLGTRIWGAPMPWEYNLEYVYQFGRFGSGNIEAWTASNAVRYNFQTLPLRPSLGLRFDFASGNRNPRSSGLQTFNPLFPSGAYFNLANPIGPQNIIDLHPVLNLQLGAKVTMTADWNFFWRESLGDGIYSPAGVPLRTPSFGQARYIGNSPSLTAAWQATRHVTVLASYVHFFDGPYLKQNPPAKDIDYVTLWIDYTF
jgi:hypothetical protein